MKIGLFYGSSTCYTEIAAEKIQAFIGTDIVDLFNIKNTPPFTDWVIKRAMESGLLMRLAYYITSC